MLGGNLQEAWLRISHAWYGISYIEKCELSEFFLQRLLDGSRNTLEHLILDNCAVSAEAIKILYQFPRLLTLELGYAHLLNDELRRLNVPFPHLNKLIVGKEHVIEMAPMIC